MSDTEPVEAEEAPEDTRSDAQRSLDDLKAQSEAAESDEAREALRAPLEAAYAAFVAELANPEPVPVVDTSETPIEVPLTADIGMVAQAN